MLAERQGYSEHSGRGEEGKSKGEVARKKKKTPPPSRIWSEGGGNNEGEGARQENNRTPLCLMFGVGERVGGPVGGFVVGGVKRVRGGKVC
jgi:hypothetical protein